MGLLLANKGDILVNNIPLCDENIRAWQNSIAHVPQTIYLSDNSIAENIAFGIPLCSLDMERVKLAAQKANIAEDLQYADNIGSAIGAIGGIAFRRLFPE